MKIILITTLENEDNNNKDNINGIIISIKLILSVISMQIISINTS